MSDIPSYWDCEEHILIKGDPCPMCERDAKIARLQAVVDAARTDCYLHPRPCQCPLCRAIRAYDGEVKP